MGRALVNGKPVVTPAEQIPVAELKQLAGVPKNYRLYDKQGTIYDDDDVVETDDEQYGVVEPWARGQKTHGQ